MKDLVLLDIRLNQFDEEGQSTEATTVDDVNPGDNDQDNGANDPTPTDKFEELINGEYKEAFQERTQKIIDKRFAKSKELETKHSALENQYNRMADVLKKRFGTENVDEALSTIEKESIENEAYERGVDVEVVQKERQLEAENRELKLKNTDLTKEKQTWHEQQKQAEQIKAWKVEEGNLQKLYPDFKLIDAVDNPTFVRLLNNNVDMESALRVAFPDMYTARVESALVKDPNRGRPRENAASTKNSGQFTLNKKAPSEMTAKERKELADKARRGEKITFN
jgi:hypothetical protein